MSRLSLMLVSLVAAIPAGYLSYELVMTFVNRAENMVTMLHVLAGTTLAMGALLTLMPIGILLFGPKTEKPAKGEQEEAGAGAAEEEEIPEAELDEEEELIAEAELEDEEAVEADAVAEADDFAEFDDFADVEDFEEDDTGKA